MVLWEARDRICGKWLKPLIPLLITAMERHGHFELDEKVRVRLCEIGPATIDRVLTPVRAGGSEECAPLLFREQHLLSEVMTALCPALPFPLLGFDTDNDSVFMNETIKDGCETV